MLNIQIWLWDAGLGEKQPRLESIQCGHREKAESGEREVGRRSETSASLYPSMYGGAIFLPFSLACSLPGLSASLSLIVSYSHSAAKIICPVLQGFLTSPKIEISLNDRDLNMAFQISIGDVLMLSKLARDILQAFTSGRKSAPAEFQEVQNQLSSLSHALDSLKSLSWQHPGQGDGDSGDSGSSITPILQNCCVTLEHLEKLVSKYMIIKDQAAGGSEKKRWSDEIRKNWKKVRWTREGGDLMKLQHNLGVHINSLHLTIAVLNRYVSPRLITGIRVIYSQVK